MSQCMPSKKETLTCVDGILRSRRRGMILRPKTLAQSLRVTPTRVSATGMLFLLFLGWGESPETEIVSAPSGF